MGQVFRARDIRLDRIVALKMYDVRLDEMQEHRFRERFEREARICASLEHPNIVRIHSCSAFERVLAIDMELLRGQDFSRVIASGEPAILSDRLGLMIQMCDGLSYAHRNAIIHRDIKPANLFLCDDGVVKILDFGLARPPGSTLSRAGVPLGTRTYMSPEQLQSGSCDVSSDTFSLGVVFSEFLTGRHPFGRDDQRIAQNNREDLRACGIPLGEPLIALIDDMLQPDTAVRRDRVSSVRYVGARLRNIHEGIASSEVVPKSAEVIDIAGAPAIADDPPSSDPAVNSTPRAFSFSSPRPTGRPRRFPGRLLLVGIPLAAAVGAVLWGVSRVPWRAPERAEGYAIVATADAALFEQRDSPRPFVTLRRGDRVEIMKMPQFKTEQWVKARMVAAGRALATGYLRVAHLEQWNSDDPQTALRLLTLFAPETDLRPADANSPTASVEACRAHLRRLSEFASRFGPFQKQFVSLERAKYLIALAGTAIGRSRQEAGELLQEALANLAEADGEPALQERVRIWRGLAQSVDARLSEPQRAR
jgi:serine/threonine protein kinase